MPGVPYEMKIAMEEQILPYLEERKLAIWTHNKAIQKSLESYRITPEQKVYLRTLKIRPASGR